MRRAGPAMARWGGAGRAPRSRGPRALLPQRKSSAPGKRRGRCHGATPFLSDTAGAGPRGGRDLRGRGSERWFSALFGLRWNNKVASVEAAGQSPTARPGGGTHVAASAALPPRRTGLPIEAASSPESRGFYLRSRSHTHRAAASGDCCACPDSQLALPASAFLAAAASSGAEGWVSPFKAFNGSAPTAPGTRPAGQELQKTLQFCDAASVPPERPSQGCGRQSPEGCSLTSLPTY